MNLLEIWTVLVKIGLELSLKLLFFTEEETNFYKFRGNVILFYICLKESM